MPEKGKREGMCTRAKRPKAARKWGQKDGGHVGAGRRRWGDGRVRAGEQGARARPEAQACPARVPVAARPARGAVWPRSTVNAPPAPARTSLTCAPGQAAAFLARPQPAPPHGPARPTLAPRGPYLLAADAAVHRPAVSAVARSRSRRLQPEPEGASPSPLPHRVRSQYPSSQGSRALRQTNCNSRPVAGRRRTTTQARWSGEAGRWKRNRAVKRRAGVTSALPEVL
ncbi:uncharacterized protein LOC144582802 [Callithrix jacchus]